jgi:hypothetical protein
VKGANVQYYGNVEPELGQYGPCVAEFFRVADPDPRGFVASYLDDAHITWRFFIAFTSGQVV